LKKIHLKTRSIFSTSGAVGRDGGRSGPERSVELKKERKKGSREDVRPGLLWMRKEKGKEEGKRSRPAMPSSV